MNMGQKKCSKCGWILNTDQFHSKGGKNKSGLYSWCKACHAAYQKEAREANKKKSNKRIQELRAIRRKVIQDLIVEHLKANPCKECGESDILCLDFDHRKPQEKEFCISRAVHLVPSLEKVKNEVAKCDILCANCHRKKTARENGNFKLGAW